MDIVATEDFSSLVTDSFNENHEGIIEMSMIVAPLCDCFPTLLFVSNNNDKKQNFIFLIWASRVGFFIFPE
ncbi:MAG: hypothetical protein WBA71_04125 [Candidatus Humimicrobiia bacterium]